MRKAGFESGKCEGAECEITMVGDNIPPGKDTAEVFKGQLAFPTTAFYDSKGELVHVKQGGYSDEQDLVDDIERYAK